MEVYAKLLKSDEKPYSGDVALDATWQAIVACGQWGWNVADIGQAPLEIEELAAAPETEGVTLIPLGFELIGDIFKFVNSPTGKALLTGWSAGNGIVDATELPAGFSDCSNQIQAAQAAWQAHADPPTAGYLRVELPAAPRRVPPIRDCARLHGDHKRLCNYIVSLRMQVASGDAQAAPIAAALALTMNRLSGALKAHSRRGIIIQATMLEALTAELDAVRRQQAAVAERFANMLRLFDLKVTLSPKLLTLGASYVRTHLRRAGVTGSRVNEALADAPTDFGILMTKLFSDRGGSVVADQVTIPGLKAVVFGMERQHQLATRLGNGLLRDLAAATPAAARARAMQRFSRRAEGAPRPVAALLLAAAQPLMHSHAH
jgi:hypothetical protein